jgi:hypothetical protein
MKFGFISVVGTMPHHDFRVDIYGDFLMVSLIYWPLLGSQPINRRSERQD